MKKHETAKANAGIYDRYMACWALWEEIKDRDETFGSFNVHTYLSERSRAVGLGYGGLNEVASQGYKSAVKALYEQARHDCVQAGLLSEAGEWL